MNGFPYIMPERPWLARRRRRRTRRRLAASSFLAVTIALAVIFLTHAATLKRWSSHPLHHTERLAMRGMHHAGAWLRSIR